MIKIKRGAPVLSEFKVAKLIAEFQKNSLPIKDIYAEYTHFIDLKEELNSDENRIIEGIKKLIEA